MTAVAQQTRRRFLQLASCVLGALGAWLVAANPRTLENLLFGPRRRSADQLSPDEFRAALGTSVEITSAFGTRFTARIARIRQLSCAPRLQQFSVLLESSLDEPQPQDNYRIEHPELGSCELLLVPVVSRRSHIDYEATFTRFLS